MRRLILLFTLMGAISAYGAILSVCATAAPELKGAEVGSNVPAVTTGKPLFRAFAPENIVVNGKCVGVSTLQRIASAFRGSNCEIVVHLANKQSFTFLLPPDQMFLPGPLILDWKNGGPVLVYGKRTYRPQETGAIKV